jgi:hypothetical protein
MDELIKRLRESGNVEKAIFLNVAWTHFKRYLDQGDNMGVIFNKLRIDTVLDILEIENFLIGDEYKKISEEVCNLRRERSA